MYLKKIYSEPLGLFEPVEFKNGLNFIYGVKDKDEPRESLNSIGKSTFLDLIDFTLLASYTKSHNKRLFKAKEIMADYLIVLEFKIGQKEFNIKRNVNDPNFIQFGLLGEEITTYKIQDAKNILSSLIFKRKDYEGAFFPQKWFRNLITFYIKIQKFKQAKFLDPVKYIQEITEPEINLYHFYLLNLNNTIPNKIYENRVRQKGISTTIKEVAKYVEEKYDIKDLKQAQIETTKLKLEIKKISDALDKFELGEQYHDAEHEANILTERIKNNLYHNFADNEKLKAYKSSFSQPAQINMRRINSMYKDVSEKLSLQIKKTLTEAVEFRKKLNESRQNFLQLEIDRLKQNIELRNEIIKEAEEERAKIFYFLSAKEAITDLTEAFYNLNEKRNRLGDLEGNTKILFDLKREHDEIIGGLNRLSNESVEFLNESVEEILKFSENFNTIYNDIYLNKNTDSQFSIIGGSKKNSIIEIDITLPDMFGKGKNQGRTLIYDLAILMYNILHTVNFPRFLIHDGIFDGVDKAHFVSVSKFINTVASKGMPIQYITTINEEGTLSEKFGDEGFVNPKFIEDNSILTLSPSRKLFNIDF